MLLSTFHTGDLGRCHLVEWLAAVSVLDFYLLLCLVMHGQLRLGREDSEMYDSFWEEGNCQQQQAETVIV
jgi:hypothetical protein